MAGRSVLFALVKQAGPGLGLLMGQAGIHYQAKSRLWAQGTAGDCQSTPQWMPRGNVFSSDFLFSKKSQKSGF